ncbi:MAG: 50S ribosomal protein L9 [Bacilli bacterium]|jgi:large subunit ribosomal protein L9|nr:50S ribosomal protein L9 [Bacilli bacterium]
MKIILLEDVRGKGKKDDVIEVASGYALHLIRENKAIDANKKSMSNLKQAQQAKIDEDKRKEAQAKKDKVTLEKNKLNFTLNVGKDGKVFKSISHKQIIEKINSEFNIKVDKKMFRSNETINNLGTTKVDIELFKGVIATVDVVIKAA